MPDRIINGSDINSDSPKWNDAALWLAANDLDANRIPADAELHIHDGQLEFEEFVLDDDGHSVLAEDKQSVLTVKRSVPLLVPPEDFNL